MLKSYLLFLILFIGLINLLFKTLIFFHDLCKLHHHLFTLSLILQLLLLIDHLELSDTCLQFLDLN